MVTSPLVIQELILYSLLTGDASFKVSPPRLIKIAYIVGLKLDKKAINDSLLAKMYPIQSFF